jgi:hypothetical protein
MEMNHSYMMMTTAKDNNCSFAYFQILTKLRIVIQLAGLAELFEFVLLDY